MQNTNKSPILTFNQYITECAQSGAEVDATPQSTPSLTSAELTESEADIMVESPIAMDEGHNFKSLDEFTKCFKAIEVMIRREDFVDWVDKSGAMANKQLSALYVQMNKLYGSIQK